MRIPLLVRYPREISATGVSEQITLNVDFAPTLLDYTGIPIPDDMQGRSLRASLAGEMPADWRTSMYYRYWMHLAHFNIAAHYGVRTERYKLIYYYWMLLLGHQQVPFDPFLSNRSPYQN